MSILSPPQLQQKQQQQQQREEEGVKRRKFLLVCTCHQKATDNREDPLPPMFSSAVMNVPFHVHFPVHWTSLKCCVCSSSLSSIRKSEHWMTIIPWMESDADLQMIPPIYCQTCRIILFPIQFDPCRFCSQPSAES